MFPCPSIYVSPTALERLSLLKALASRLDEGRAAWAGWSITASSSRLSRSVQEPGQGEAASCSIVQYSTVQYSTVQYSSVQYSQ